MDDWLAHVLAAEEEGVVFASGGAGEDFVRLLKFERARVATDLEAELAEWTLDVPDDEKSWQLPDGRTVVPRRPLGLLAGEVMFDHCVVGLDGPEFCHGACSSAAGAGQGLREALWGNVLLVSTTTTTKATTTSRESSRLLLTKGTLGWR